MAPQTIHLPDGQTFTVSPVFAGVGFRSHELNMHPHAYPVGWTVVLQTEAEAEAGSGPGGDAGGAVHSADADEGDEDGADEGGARRSRQPRRIVHSFKKPTLNNDSLFISSVSSPSNNEFKPAASPTRQIALMLWVSLYWYFHQPEPEPYLNPVAAAGVPSKARPKGDWTIHIKREGVFRGRNLIPKLERMGLIRSADSAVGTSLGDNGDAWSDMFVSRRLFWQLPSRLFLFTLQPTKPLTSFPGTPFGSRPSSPIRKASPHGQQHHQQSSSVSSPFSSAQSLDGDFAAAAIPILAASGAGGSLLSGPYNSTSHLPTYFPPPPLLYTMTDNVRHPFRPKPHRMGEIFYNRFVPSVGQYLSFRVASISPDPVLYLGPLGHKGQEHAHLCALSDSALLQSWMAQPRVKAFWGEYSPGFLATALSSKHSFPVIGLWDGVPFGYFEIYWVKEDLLGRHLGSEAGDWDRGLHVLVGEEWARGRVPIWILSLVHWALAADFRTMNVCLEPRIDNEKYERSKPPPSSRVVASFWTEREIASRFIQRLEQSGFNRERQVSLPHKQAVWVRMRRECWDGPAL